MAKKSDPGRAVLPIKVWASGVPKGQPRGRAFVTGGRARIFTPGTAEAWKGDIARAFENRMPAGPLDGPLEMRIDLHFKRPGRLLRKKDPDHPLPCPGLPDWDNAGKAISDALEHLGVIANDKTIAFATVRKWYSARGGKTGALIRLYAVDDDAWPAMHRDRGADCDPTPKRKRARPKAPPKVKLFDEPERPAEQLDFVKPPQARRKKRNRTRIDPESTAGADLAKHTGSCAIWKRQPCDCPIAKTGHPFVETDADDWPEDDRGFAERRPKLAKTLRDHGGER